MFLYGKYQYSENIYAAQVNLQIQCNLPIGFFIGLEQKNLQIVWKHKRPQIANVILRNKTRAGGIRRLHFKLYYKAYSRKPRENKPIHLRSTNL